MNNRLIIAAAGSGKTTRIVQEALALEKTANILITTYTEANKDEIIAKFQKRHGCIPNNVDVLTWFSFLLQHGARPYQTILDNNLEGVRIRFDLVNSQSGIRQSGSNGQFYRIASKENVMEYYFSNNYSIYSDKISDFIIETNKKGRGVVFARLKKLYSHIFIDEAQDLAGWDLGVAKELSQTVANLCMVCDPRQAVYRTNPSRKYSNYSEGRIKDFINEHCQQSEFDIDECSLSKTHRFGENIATFSSLIFPDFPAARPCNENGCRHDDRHQGVFKIKSTDVSSYLKKYPGAKILRYRESNPVRNEMNIRLAKGLTFDRVLIYPTNKILNYMKTGKVEYLDNSIRTIFYVASTRARISATIVYDQETCGFDDLVKPWSK